MSIEKKQFAPEADRDNDTTRNIDQEPVKKELSILKQEIQEKQEKQEKQEVTMEDIKKLKFTPSNLVSSDSIMAAFTNLEKINPILGEQIGGLIKQGDILGIQTALGMKKGSSSAYNKADGDLGKYTINNLGSGKIININLTPVTNTGGGFISIDFVTPTIVVPNINDIWKWGRTGDLSFYYTQSALSGMRFYGNKRFSQMNFNTNASANARGNWEFNENHNVVLTFDK